MNASTSFERWAGRRGDIRRSPWLAPVATRAHATLLAVCLGAPGCGRVLGADFDGRHLAAPPADASVALEAATPDASGTSGLRGPTDAAPRACEAILPAIEVATAGAVPELWFAVSKSDFGDRVADGGLAADTIGRDLPGAHRCISPPWAVAASEMPGGIDNALGRAYFGFSEGAGSSAVPASVVVNVAIRLGYDTVLVRLRGWNGTADDPEVELVFVDGSMGTVALDQGHGEPAWHGQDVWNASAAALQPANGGRRPTVFARGAVRGFRASAFVVGGSVGLLAQYTWAGTLERGPYGYRIRDGLISGVVTTHTLFTIAGANAASAGRLCTNSPLYARPGGFKEAMCSHVDVDSDGDGTCDALSAGSTFEAEPIVVGCPIEFGEQPRCPTAFDPQLDRCEASDAGGG
jgi:hypothetical protein